MRDHYDEGRDAYRDHHRRGDNPYEQFGGYDQQQAHDDWNNGFRSAERREEERREQEQYEEECGRRRYEEQHQREQEEAYNLEQQQMEEDILRQQMEEDSRNAEDGEQ